MEGQRDRRSSGVGKAVDHSIPTSHRHAFYMDTPAKKTLGRLLHGLITILGVTGIVGGRPITAFSQWPSVPANAEADAALHGVWFVDADRGWAVGDRGVIWRTTDGGRSWHPQPSGVNCRLDDIVFSRDGRIGLIVGGWTRPHTGETVGVVLRSDDGGNSWTVVPTPTLPTLFRVKLFNAQEGLALGVSSARHPWGTFRTTDGGRSWNALPLGTWGQLLAGDFSSLQQGVLAAHDGRLLHVYSDRAVPCRTAPVAARAVRAMAIYGSNGWLVGDRGLVMRTADAGANWQLVQNLTPDGAHQMMDFRAIAVLGDHCWIAGSPGSVIFHSADGGTTWQRNVTTVTVAIEDLCFLDERRGWAVGALGTILGTRDGGRTWWTMQSGGDRLAAMGFWPEPRSAPWEWLAWYGADQGYFIGWTFLAPTQAEDARNAAWHMERRTEEAVALAGGTVTCWAGPLPLPPAELNWSQQEILQQWNHASDGQAERQLEQHLVRQIRQWKCDVVIVPDADSEQQPLQSLLQHLVLRAVHRAADGTAYSELTSLGLEPWRVPKVVAVKMASKPGELSPLRVDATQLSATLGMSLGDLTTVCKGLVQADSLSGTSQWLGRFLLDLAPQTSTTTDVFSGSKYRAHGVRRPPTAPATADLERLSTVTQKRRNVERLLNAKQPFPGIPENWSSQIGDLVDGLPEATKAVLLYQLAQRYVELGQWELAAQVCERLVKECPQHDAARRAAGWLIACYASNEVAWRLRCQTGRQTSLVVPVSTDQGATGEQPKHDESAPQLQFQTVGGKAALQTPTTFRARQSLDMAQYVATHDPTLFDRPEVRFPWCVAQRTVGQNRQAEAYFDQLAATGMDAAWRASAQTEQWLRHGRGLPPKPLAVCIRAATPPYLDGDLRDEVWQRSQPIQLHSPRYDDQDWPCSAQLAYDDEFLYLAVQARHTPQDSYPSDKTVRQHDADLSKYDRVEFLFDTDRDYVSYYRLSVDYRGRPWDACWNDTTWNPTWYIASQDDGRSWTVEAAVAWQELADRPPRANQAWAFQIHRIAPRTGFQAWSSPAAPSILPQGFGILLFQ